MANTWVGLMAGRWDGGVSSCQDGSDASGHVMSWMDYVNLDLETMGLGRVDWERVKLCLVGLGQGDTGQVVFVRLSPVWNS